MTTGAAASLWAVMPTVVRQVLDHSCAAIRIGATSANLDFTYADGTVPAFLAIGLAKDIGFGCNRCAVSVADMSDRAVALGEYSRSVEHDTERSAPRRFRSPRDACRQQPPGLSRWLAAQRGARRRTDAQWHGMVGATGFPAAWCAESANSSHNGSTPKQGWSGFG